LTGSYGDRGRAAAARRDAEARRSIRISRLRLATFLPAAGCLLWVLARGWSPLPLIASVVLFGAFGALVVWHARVDDRAAWHEALRVVCERAIARVGRRWDALPPAEPPAGQDLTHHPYALDLDLFGRASLGQWLGPSATSHGASSLARWLLHPAPPDEVIARQQAVEELAPASDWREELAAHGVLTSGARAAEIGRFLAWAEGPDLFGPYAIPLRAAVLILTAAIWILGALHLFDVTAGAFWLIPMLIGLVLSFGTALRVHTAFTRAGLGQRALSGYAGLFEHATTSPSRAPRLKDVRSRLTAAGAAAPACMRRLNAILGFAELRTGAAILHFPVQAFTLWDFHVVFALERWREAAGSRVRGWMEALGELDALSTLARVRYDNPTWCVPLLTAAPHVVGRQVGHPLLPDDRRVGNDVEVGPPGTILLVTGSNMSGKSTLLRAMGLNTVLAQAGAPACAAAFELPPSDLQTSIRVQDSLELGLSYFMAALARLKGVVDAAERPRVPGRVLLYLLDEILQGTNSAERAVAVRAVARHLLDAGAIGAMTTHDLAIAAEPPFDKAARLVHFTETVDESGHMAFDYRLRPGLATSRNALRLMKLIGIEL
jgi:hypothetical protein